MLISFRDTMGELLGLALNRDGPFLERLTCMDSRTYQRAGRIDTHPRLARLTFVFVLLALGALVLVPVLVQDRVHAVRAEVEDVADPARTLVLRLQLTLSLEMSALRGFLLNRQEHHLAPYAEGRGAERRITAELETLTSELGGEVPRRFEEMRALIERWHEQAGDSSGLEVRDLALRKIEEAQRRQELFEEALRAAGRLDASILQAVHRRRAEIRSLERFGLLSTTALVLIALGAAIAVGWLDQRVRHLAAEAQRALAESARSDEARSRLLRGVTHDVKNPLGAASGYAQLLEMKIKGELNPEQMNLVGGIRRSIDGALLLITDLLDLAQDDSGGLAMHPEPTDLGRLIGEVVEGHRASAELARLTMEWDESPEPLIVNSDPGRVRQVLDNLLSNAVKYTPGSGRIEIRARVNDGAGTPHAASWLVVQVRDTGPGIAPDRREAVFDEFTRLDAHDTKGHGIGLAISRRIARALGGDLRIAAVDRDGAVFEFWLPGRSSQVAGRDSPDRVPN